MHRWDDNWEPLTRRVAIATTALLVFYLAWYMHRFSDFSNDDLDNFVVMQHSDFWRYLITPVDVHYAPFHRLMSWVVYHVAPMNFMVPSAVLLLLHVGTLIFLARTLRLLRAGQMGGLIVGGYAASAIVVYGLVWWAQAQHRAPYVLLDVVAIYNYLAWMNNGKRLHLFFMAFAFLLAFGCYEKAVFIPIHVVLIGYLNDERGFRVSLRKFISVPLGMLLCSGLYTVSYLLLLNGGAVKSPLFSAVRSDFEFVEAFFTAGFGLGMEGVHEAPVQGMTLRLLVLVVELGIITLLSLWRGRGSWKILLAAFSILAIDYLPISLSNRGLLIGTRIAQQTRFGYEELHLMALLAGIWCARIGLADAEGVRQRQIWFSSFVLLVAYVVVNVNEVRLGRQYPLSTLWVMDHSHRYLKNLRAGEVALAGESPIFQNDRVPHYLSMFWRTPDTRTLLPLFLPHAKFDDAAVPRYSVLQDGRIVQLQ